VFNLSAIKLLIILVVVVIFLGPDKLPEAAQKVGRFWAAFKLWQQRIEGEVREAIPNLPSTEALGKYARRPRSLLDNLAERANAELAESNVPFVDEDEVPIMKQAPVTRKPTDPSFDPGLN
jgi:Sec-independent protein translocase protein TatA